MAGASDEKRHGAAAVTAHVDLAFKDEDHEVGGGSFFKESFTGLGNDFDPVPGEPEPVFKGQAVQWRHVVDGSGDLFDGRRTGRRGEDGRKPSGNLLGADSG